MDRQLRSNFDTHGTQTEELLNEGVSLDIVLQVARAKAFDEEDALLCVESTRPTHPFFQGEPWR